MSVIASQITSLTVVYSTVYSGVDQTKHQSSESLAFCEGNSPVPGQLTSNAENVAIWWDHQYLACQWPCHTLPINLHVTHWGRVTHICVGKLTIIGSEYGLSPSRRQAIVWTNAGLLSSGTLRIYFSEISIKTQQFSLKKMHLKMLSAKRRLCWLGPNVLSHQICRLQALAICPRYWCPITIPQSACHWVTFHR